MTRCSVINIFDQTAGFYWSITLLLKSPFLCTPYVHIGIPHYIHGNCTATTSMIKIHASVDKWQHCHSYESNICSAQSENLRNLEIVLHILRILRLRSNLEIAHPISRLHNYHTCAISRSRKLRAQSTNFHLASPPEIERLLWICSSQDRRQPW